MYVALDLFCLAVSLTTLVAAELSVVTGVAGWTTSSPKIHPVGRMRWMNSDARNEPFRKASKVRLQPPQMCNLGFALT